MIIALAGGVGGAKLVHGLAQTLPPERLLAVVNTGDDFTHVGLPVCPDLDTVMYTLAGLANPETGWGIAGETWRFMDSLGRLGGETWFRLGDQDLATHVRRKGLLVPVTPVTPVQAGETVETVDVRFRTVGDITCTCPVESPAATAAEVVIETISANVSERGATRMDDKTSDASMEKRKKDGYF